MNLYLCREPVRRFDIEMFIHPGLETLASYIAIAKRKTSGRIRQVTEKLEKDSDRFRLTSETVERLAANFNVTDLYKTREKSRVVCPKASLMTPDKSKGLQPM